MHSSVTQSTQGNQLLKRKVYCGSLLEDSGPFALRLWQSWTCRQDRFSGQSHPRHLLGSIEEESRVSEFLQALVYRDAPQPMSPSSEGATTPRHLQVLLLAHGLWRCHQPKQNNGDGFSAVASCLLVVCFETSGLIFSCMSSSA